MSIFTPINLRVNRGSSKAAVVANQTPVFSWGIKHEDNNRRQKAWNIRVIDLNDSERLLWDSGWVCSDEQEAVYAGEALASGRRICWELTLKDDAGNVSASVCAEFLTALLGEWQAGWIAPQEGYGKAAIYFRREFEVKEGLKNAVLFCCGIGYQYVTVNGISADCTELGESLMQPAFTNYNEYCSYVTIPINGLINDCENCLGIVVANGWRNNADDNILYIENAKHGMKMAFSGTPELTAQLMLEYDDGHTEWILTDESWQCGKGGVTYADVFNGERFDARLEPWGFDTCGFEGEGFENAAVAKAPAGELRPQIIEPIVEQKRYPAKTVTPLGNCKYLVDFGTNIAGWVELCIPALEAGTEITLIHAEELDEEKELHMANLRKAEQKDVYISDGEEALWAPKFTYHGFRWATIEGIPAFEAEMAEAVSVYNDVDSGSFFECGSAVANAIQQIIVQTERDNIHGILTDCPQRDERQGWMNDATVRFEETPYNFDVGRIFPKVIDDIIADQGENGAITCTAPFVWGQRPGDPVCSSFLVAGVQNLMHNGDIETLKRVYPNYKAWNAFLASEAEKGNGIVEYSYYGDWAGPEDGCEAPEVARSGITPGALMSTGYHYYNYILLAKIAEYLGMKEEMKENLTCAAKVKKAFLEKWWNEETGIVATGSQACQAFALWLGILPEEGRVLAAEKLNEAVVSVGTRITTGNLCTRYLFDMLAEYGYVDTAWALITREEYPSWGYMLQNGATTVWERFEMKENGGMNSHNHPMFGAVGYWFYAYVAGVRPSAPGWKTFTVKPYIPEKLTFAEAKVNSVKGEIRVKWLKRYGKCILSVVVPFGCTAVVEFDGKTETVGAGFHTFETKL
ncbi:MAG: hypothetical protein E7487_03490 [Ruminococcaceae bacterium]|nr:hypothetical protein [Oscillospiraceae bacterium]